MPTPEHTPSGHRYGPNCIPAHRCHNWRACPACGALRQKRIADAAQRLAQVAGSIDWHTITPEQQTAQAIAQERARWLRSAHPPGAIWTIERGEQAGKLHLNILVPAGTTSTAPTAATFLVQSVRDPRAVAAYISKRAQAPTPEEYPGRTFGTAGPLWQWLTAKDQAAPVQAAAVQADINRAAGPHPSRPATPPVACAADLDRADYRAIMARRLPDLVSLRAQLRTAAMLNAAPYSPN